MYLASLFRLSVTTNCRFFRPQNCHLSVILVSGVVKTLKPSPHLSSLTLPFTGAKSSLGLLLGTHPSQRKTMMSKSTAMERLRSTKYSDDKDDCVPKVKPRRSSLSHSLAKNFDKLMSTSKATSVYSDDEDVCVRKAKPRRPSLTNSLAKNLDKLICITPTRKKKGTVACAKLMGGGHPGFSCGIADSAGTETSSPSRSTVVFKGQGFSPYSSFRKDSDNDDDDEGSIDLNFNSDATPFVGEKRTPPSPMSPPNAGIGSFFCPAAPLPRGHASTPNLAVPMDLEDSPKSVMGGDEPTTPSQLQKKSIMQMFSNSCSRFTYRHDSSDDMSSDAYSLGDSMDSPRSTKGSLSSYYSKAGVLATPVKTIRRRLRKNDLPGPPSLAGDSCPSIDGGYESTCSGCSLSSTGSMSIGGTTKVKRVKRSKSKVKATALLDGIRLELEMQTRAKQEHDRFINTQVKIARTRLSMGNEISAALAYKKVKKVEAERARVVRAIEVLEEHLAGVQGQLEKAKAIAEAQLCEGNKNSHTKVIIDFKAHKNYAQEVAQILSLDGSEDEELLHMSRKDLLDEMEAFTM